MLIKPAGQDDRSGLVARPLQGSDHVHFGVWKTDRNMAFAATTLRALISCPVDVMPEDLSVIHQAITRWIVLPGGSSGMS